MTTFRTFIALDFPCPVLDKIKKIQKSIDSSYSSIIRWTKPENIHLTLKFLGEVKIEKIQTIEKSLDSIANKMEPFKIDLSEIGAFPNWGHPRIIWIGLEKSEPLLLLAKEIEENMNEIGFEREIRPFSPHLTIGRVRDDTSFKDFQMMENKCRTFTRIEDRIPINNIYIYKSDLQPFGPIYSLLHSSPFKLA